MMIWTRSLRARSLALGLVFLLCIAGCRIADDTAAPTLLPSPTTLPTQVITPTDQAVGTGSIPGLSAEETESLSSLRKVDDFPLYTMHYAGSYGEPIAELNGQGSEESSNEAAQTLEQTWACSLFAAFGANSVVGASSGDSSGMLYGRNFDWRFSPALLLFTDPPGGYASVSMVDIEYLGYGGERSAELDQLPLGERVRLLDAPMIPFDGMNEMGLVMGMAAVPPGDIQPDPDKEVIGSLGVIREVLDHASDVDEAVAIIANYNVDMGDGPPLHYLIADATGQGVLVEFFRGEMIVIPNQLPWHRATNFLRSAHDDSAEGVCRRYDELDQTLEEKEGQLSTTEAMDLLQRVSQENTQWSVVYSMNSGEVLVAMGREYDDLHAFDMDGEGG